MFAIFQKHTITSLFEETEYSILFYGKLLKKERGSPNVGMPHYY